MNLIIGHVGSDAGYWVVGPDGHIHHVGGWNPEAFAELAAAVNVISEATRLKTPGLAEAAAKSVMGFVQAQLGEHLKEGGVLVIS